MAKVRGAYIQLFAYGASDNWLIARGTCDPYACNNRDSMMYWFLDRETGYAEKNDMFSVIDMPGVLDHVPSVMKPSADSMQPFSINTERACVKIQRAWKNASELKRMKHTLATE